MDAEDDPELVITHVTRDYPKEDEIVLCDKRCNTCEFFGGQHQCNNEQELIKEHETQIEKEIERRRQKDNKNPSKNDNPEWATVGC
jgi:hypothetical protein